MCCKLCYPLWIQRNSQVYGSKNSGIVIKIPMLSETSTKMDWREKKWEEEKAKVGGGGWEASLQCGTAGPVTHC